MVKLLTTLVLIKNLSSNYLILLIILTIPNSSVHLYAFTDSGGSAMAFMDFKFAVAHRFKVIKLLKPITLNVVNGKVIASGLITHYVKAPMQISEH